MLFKGPGNFDITRISLKKSFCFHNMTCPWFGRRMNQSAVAPSWCTRTNSVFNHTSELKRFSTDKVYSLYPPPLSYGIKLSTNTVGFGIQWKLTLLSSSPGVNSVSPSGSVLVIRFDRSFREKRCRYAWQNKAVNSDHCHGCLANLWSDSDCSPYHLSPSISYLLVSYAWCNFIPTSFLRERIFFFTFVVVVCHDWL